MLTAGGRELLFSGVVTGKLFTRLRMTSLFVLAHASLTEPIGTRKKKKRKIKQLLKVEMDLVEKRAGIRGLDRRQEEVIGKG